MIATWTDDMPGDLDVATMDTPDVFECLMLTDNDHPLWPDKHPTAFRLKGKIASVISYARVMRRRTTLNCSSWKDNLDHLLSRAVHKPEPHPSLHPDQIAEFMVTLRSLDGMAYRCLDATIMTGLRSNESLGARWSEFDFDAGTWRVPGSRMKKRKDHVVVLSQQAITLFKRLPRDGELVFGDLGVEALRDAVTEVMVVAGREWVDRRSGKVIVPHGFRSSFATWAGSVATKMP